MRLIYIEATKQELEANKTLCDSLTEALTGFANSIVSFKPVVRAKYEFEQEDDS